MKFILLLVMAMAATVYAETIPYNNETNTRFKAIETTNTTQTSDITTLQGIAGTTAYAADGILAKRVARATFDFADGDLAVGAHSLGVALPAKTLITRSYIRIETQLVDTGTCTVAIHCEDANNIKTATDITGTAANGFIEGQSTGAASAFVASIAAACNITLTVANGGSCVPSAGKGEVYVEYVVQN